jgi:hypothetical protein
VLTVSFIKAVALFLVFSNFVRDTLDKVKEKSGIPRSRDLENMQPTSALLIETIKYIILLGYMSFTAHNL